VFLALVGLVVAVGQLSRQMMYRLHVDAQNIAEGEWGDVELASEALEYSNQNTLIIMQIVSSNDQVEIDSLLARRTNNSAKVAALLTRLQSRVDSQLEQQRLNAVLEARKPYRASCQQVTTLALHGKQGQARQFLTTDTFPKLLSYHAAFRHYYDFETDEMNQALDKSRARYETAHRKVDVLMALSVLLAVAIAAFVVIEISSEIRSRAEAEHGIKSLNAELEQTVKARTLELQKTVQRLRGEVQNREQAEEQIQFLAYYDALTGLPNRSLLHDRMTVALAGAKRRSDKVALMFVDLDNFKNINDSLGHSVGDLLLRDVAVRLKENVREQDTVARLGGDEFVIMVTGLGSTSDAALTATRVLSGLARAFNPEDYELSVTCSLGISIFPDDAASSDELLKNADLAMYCAKQNGRNNFQFFTTDMNAHATRELALQNGLRHAVERNELFLMFQPQMGLVSGEIIGAEALVRWQHPQLGLVPPDQFIPIAESTGLIISIGEWVLCSACAQAKAWQAEGSRPIPVSVNVSPLQFRQKNFPQIVRNTLSEAGLPPEYLELELTESLILSNANVVMDVLHSLREMGVRLSIDDFGTGYSNLSYLRQFPVYKLKIDRVFVKDLLTNPDDSAIVETIISMARSLNLKVIAEGVEDERQVSFLRARNCDEIQGYYFSKPLPAEDFIASLRQLLPVGK
jgi:diguanylate cyclase (GGDEF)-like protein